MLVVFGLEHREHIFAAFIRFSTMLVKNLLEIPIKVARCLHVLVTVQFFVGINTRKHLFTRSHSLNDNSILHVARVVETDCCDPNCDKKNATVDILKALMPKLGITATAVIKIYV